MEIYSVYNIKETVSKRDSLTELQKENIDVILEKFTKDNIGTTYIVDKDQEQHRINHLINNRLKESKIIKGIINDFANDLLSAEEIRDGNEVRRNRTIKSGILIVKYTRDKILFLKIEEVSIIDEEDFSFNYSYSGEKAYFKLAELYLDQEDNQTREINIIDANAKIAKYWSVNFLKLEPLNNDENNTKNFLKYLDKKTLLSDGLDDTIQADIYKSIIDYLHNKSNFEFTLLTDHINKDIKSDFKSSDIFKISIVNELDDSFHFDTTLKEQYFKLSVKVNDYVTLKIKDRFHATEGGFIKLSDDKKYFQISVDNDIDISTEFPQLVED